MRLHYREFPGPGRPLVILHGIFGSSKNWMSVGRTLSSHSHVYAIDQRNHGDSPWDESHTLDDLVGDLHEFIGEHRLMNPIILGHSMGGLVAMAFALKYPQDLSALIIEDIAPRSYGPTNVNEFAALSIDVSDAKSREDIDQRMTALVPEKIVRSFLQMNLDRTDAGYRWKIPVETLKKSTVVHNVPFSTDGKTWDGPVLFFRGGRSEYVSKVDEGLVRRYFPKAQIILIEDATHWLQFTHPDEFISQVTKFLNTIAKSDQS